MTEEHTNTNSNRKLIRWGIIVLSLLALVGIAVWYLNTSQFNDFARRRLISQLEDATGGRVEVRSFQWHLSKLEFDLRDVTIHGLEGPDEIPYAHADRILIRAKVLSWLGRQVGLRLLQIDRPVVHVIVYPDGHTNQPTPKVASRRPESAIQQVFDLAINHAEINDGKLITNNHEIPLDFGADDLQASMNYVADNKSYDGSIKFGKLNAKYSKFLPVNGEGSVKFELLPDSVVFNSFHFATDRSRLDGSGTLKNFSQPVVNISYRASVDGKELSPITRSVELRGGTFNLVGDAKFADGKLSSVGKLTVENASYYVPVVRLDRVDAAADYAFDTERLTFTHVVARIFGGIANGDITVDNWLTTSNPKAPQQTGTARFHVGNLPVGRAADAFSTRSLNFARLNLVGTAHGNVHVHWRGSPMRAVAELDLSAVPPENPKSDQIPVTADLHGSYDAASGRIQMAPLNLATPDLRVNATGVLGSASEQLHLSVASSDLSKLQPMLAVLNEQNSVAGQLTGRLKFDGTVTGKLRTPAIQGNLELADFEFPLNAVLPSPATTSAPRQPRPNRLHIDSVSGEIALNRQGIIIRHGIAHRGTSQASFDLNAALSAGKVTDESVIAAHITVTDAEFADLQQIAGYNYPVTGTLSANLNFGGTKASPQGGGHIQLQNGTIYGEPVKSVVADVHLAQQQLQLNKFVAVHNGAQLRGSGTYDFKTSAFRFQANGNNFQLAAFRRLQNLRGSVVGELNFNATGSGTLQAPIIDASAHLHNLAVNGQRVGDATLTAITQGHTLKLNARTNFQTAELSIDGSVKMHEPLWPTTLTARFTNFDFMPYLQPLMPGRINAKSFSEGTLLVTGPLRDPRQLSFKAEVPKLAVDMENVELRNSEPIRFSMADGTVRVDSFKLSGPDTQLDLRGTVRTWEDARVRLRAEGRVNLKLAQSFNSDLNSSGFADLNVFIGGVLSKPTVQGEVRITNGAVTLIDFPNGLSNINGSLVFTEDRIQVQSLTAHTGGGDIRIGGFATYTPQLTFSLTAQGQDIRLRYPQGISSTANLDLKLTGTPQNSTLSGDVTITRFGLNSQFDLAVYLAKTNRAVEVAGPSLLNNLHFNVHVTSTPELQVQSSLAKLAGNVDLRVRGTGSNPVLLGRVNVTEGQISFNGTNYRIDRGDVTFTNPTKTEPNIDVATTTRVRDYDITLEFHGQLSHGLNTNYRSDPPLPQADIINLLAFGRTREEAETVAQTGGNSYTGLVGNAILGQALNSAVGDRVQKLFGVSRVKIAPDVSSTQTNPTAQVTIEQQVSNKVTITYITSLAQSSQQSIFLEYNINPQLSLIAGRDQYGVVSFDVKIRQRKR